MGFHVTDSTGAQKVGPNSYSFTTTSTGTVNDFDFKGAALVRLNNASLLRIQGLKAGYPGQIITLYSVGAGQVDLAHQSGGSLAANRMINLTGSGKSSLVSGSATYIYDDVQARWVMTLHDQVGWITPTYASSDYFTSSASTWTVDAGDVTTDSYQLKGNILFVTFSYDLTSIAGGAVPQLRRNLHGPYGTARNQRFPFTWLENGVAGTGYAFIDSVANTISFFKDKNSTNWNNETNLTSILGSFQCLVS